jgi:hypothetical protein
MSRTAEGIKRTGRVGLWVAFPPVGLWRSIHHGKIKSEDRLAEKIAEELRREPSLIDQELARLKSEL